MNFRSDLAIEMKEASGKTNIDGVTSTEETFENARITRIEITNESGAKSIGKPIGKYITVEVPSFSNDGEILDGRLDAIKTALSELLPQEGSVLVAGLGNEKITPDALGPVCARQIFVTRHISEELAHSIGLDGLRSVSGISPGVLGQTGIETGEILAGIVKHTNPAAVITVDALASRSLARLGCTVQLANTGVTPGSGVGNSRNEISMEKLGVPVIAVGVPTVVDAATLAKDIVGDNKNVPQESGQMMVTPREIDLVIERSARLVALAINCALQPSMSAEDLLALV